MTDSPCQSTDAGAAAAAAPAVMFPVELTILDHYARQSRCVLSNLPVTLGRDEKDNVRLADPWISHSHCELFQQGSVLVVRDLDSKNGVFMHGVRVREAEVMPGDCLTLGRTEITLRYRSKGSAQDSAAGDDSTVVDGAEIAGAPASGNRRQVAGGPVTEELLY
jgi:pSer/pThr/pTyr-binding forkhead associated (FHA) protein